MSTEIVDNATSTATEGAIPALDTEVISDAALAEIFNTPEPEVAKPAAEVQPPEPETPAVTDEKPADGLDEETINQWGKETPDESPVKPDAEYLNDVVKVLPNREAANYAIDAFQRQHAFDQAIEAGNIPAALEAIPAVKQLVNVALANYLKANEEKIVQAWIARNDPDQQNPVVTDLQRQLQEVKALIGQQKQQDTQQQQAQTLKSRHEAIDKAIPEMLDRIRFTKNPEDRADVADLFRVELSRNSTLMAKVMNGDLEAMRPALAKAVNRFVAMEKRFKPAPAPTKQPETPVITKGGIPAAAEDTDDVWAKAEAYLQSSAGR